MHEQEMVGFFGKLLRTATGIPPSLLFRVLHLSPSPPLHFLQELVLQWRPLSQCSSWCRNSLFPGKAIQHFSNINNEISCLFLTPRFCEGSQGIIFPDELQLSNFEKTSQYHSQQTSGGRVPAWRICQAQACRKIRWKDLPQNHFSNKINLLGIKNQANHF